MEAGGGGSRSQARGTRAPRRPATAPAASAAEAHVAYLLSFQLGLPDPLTGATHEPRYTYARIRAFFIAPREIVFAGVLELVAPAFSRGRPLELFPIVRIYARSVDVERNRDFLIGINGRYE